MIDPPSLEIGNDGSRSAKKSKERVAENKIRAEVEHVFTLKKLTWVDHTFCGYPPVERRYTAQQ